MKRKYETIERELKQKKEHFETEFKKLLGKYVERVLFLFSQEIIILFYSIQDVKNKQMEELEIKIRELGDINETFERESIEMRSNLTSQTNQLNASQERIGLLKLELKAFKGTLLILLGFR